MASSDPHAANASLLEALAFYADADNYFETYQDETDCPVTCPALEDEGTRARAACSSNTLRPAKGLPPLDLAGVLWVAALDRVPIEERIEWVQEMVERVENLNAMRAAYVRIPSVVS